MGEVCRARDTRLDRIGALKILPVEVAADPERKRRFVREAKAASALNHPNIAAICEIGESEGTHWISMELVEGEALSQRLSEKSLEAREILDIGIQVCEALAKAHGKGIVHRDIKPANMMLTQMLRRGAGVPNGPQPVAWRCVCWPSASSGTQSVA